MNKQFIPFLMLSISINFCFAQNNFGPKLTAMGNNYVAVKDIWSLNGNVSGIADVGSPTLAINYTKYSIDNELSNQAIAFVLPLKNNYLGASFNRYGITAYNEIKAGLVLAKRFGNKLSIALKGNYHQIKISNYGSTTGFSIDVGGMYELTKQITLGLSLSNPSFQKYSSKEIETKIASSMQIGGSYKASDKILIATTISKEFNTSINVGLGIDYKLLSLISLRGGLTTKPFKHYAGFGLNFKKFVMDMAVESDIHLGYTPQIALAYAF
ncbi:PorV/PorQ family protein [Pedobacter boryungensis]|uniref:Outer membrane protein beta-barrel domain-containing protein n=1 Tax=Pedobacter boryungensis TaxID=869962 RepID=A0ABX2D9H8_9SPHI|nr:hypothetical protein [Pedobacter boryungensis]NQX30706.1 hypothetical protein [Pedobacter boryungensis]